MQLSRSLIVLLITGMLISIPDVSLQAADSDKNRENLFKNLTYPELEVTPLASERLERMARDRSSNKLKTYLPIQISAASTLIAGYYGLGRMDDKDKKGSGFKKSARKANREAAYAAMFVGTTWLGATIVLSSMYEPYLEGFRDVRTEKGNSKRARLKRERLAEEWLTKPAGLATQLKYLSVLTNFGASVYMAANTSEDGSMVAAASAVLALTPFLVESPWVSTYEKHQLYKKRIYGPVGGVFPVQDEKGNIRLGTGVRLVGTF